MKINFLDKIKFEINKRDSYQYFYQYWHYKNNLDGSKLQEALKQIYSHYPKLNKKLKIIDDDYMYNDHKFSSFYHELKPSKESMDESIQHFLSMQVNEYISSSNEAPLILVHITTKSQSTLLFLHNHIYYDGHSALALTEQLWNIIDEKQVESPPYDVSDAEILDSLSHKTILKKVNFPFCLAKHLIRSMKFSKKEKSIEKIYTKASTKVNYHSFYIRREKLGAESQDYSNNTKLVALISEQLIEMKGHLTAHQCIISIPQNIRNKKLDLFGNAVNSISIEVDKHMNLSKKMETIHQTIHKYKSPNYIKASYLLSTILTKNKKDKELLSPFVKLSKKHHCYISNHGKSDKLLQNPDLIRNGAFNYPLQEYYGLIFTLSYTKEHFCIGIASSDQIFIRKELHDFEIGIKNKVTQ
ncbi:hypothetical protein K5X82_01115 [Halosquirtibacter xylanolyticus]|uniref:hypothetical protein n=1 Tax=Halosquirtibacter xylanolyticus TaxID=3374599 RepID=UPI00374A82A4|nr:hypothetical protein K5X82_01115 [Prolixibacteraceae bacterium]